MFLTHFEMFKNTTICEPWDSTSLPNAVLGQRTSSSADRPKMRRSAFFSSRFRNLIFQNLSRENNTVPSMNLTIRALHRYNYCSANYKTWNRVIYRSIGRVCAGNFSDRRTTGYEISPQKSHPFSSSKEESLQMNGRNGRWCRRTLFKIVQCVHIR